MSCICQGIVYRSPVALNSLAQIVYQRRLNLTLKRLGLISDDRRCRLGDPNDPAGRAGRDLFRRISTTVCGMDFDLNHVRGTRRRRSR